MSSLSASRVSAAARVTRLAASVSLSLSLSVGMGGALSACKKAPPPDAVVLPTLKADTTGLELTYVDEKGNPHVVDTVGEVPGAQAQEVRVTDPAHAAPDDSMFVADLRQAKADGTFAVKVVPRDEFEGIMVARRKALGPTLASGNGAPGAADGDGGAGSANAAGIAANAEPRVTIYGASWCGACHEAAAWLKSKNVRFVEKDIEKDSGAEREMRAKLAKSGLRGGGIPVIDVGGKIMVGFSAPQLQAALGESI